MADILLIHGSCHGAWCWDKLIPCLNAKGHMARAIDLPSHGADDTPVQTVTLDCYAQAIVENCHEQTTLVGHSMGGYAISAAAERVPEQIAQLIYLCAYVPQNGMTLAQMRKKAPRQPLLPAVRMAPDGLSFTIDPEMAPDIFYHDCAPGDVEFALTRLCPQAVAPTNAPLADMSAVEKLPRSYIRCMDDRTVPPEFQVTMTQDWPAQRLHQMDCGHSPFFSDPETLATHIDQAIRG
ncbi:esterase [Roseobacter denitrificans]|uniref:Esterase EstC, putative n=1 Tax=Roseobacter denitrificans (strain ATCC 33942 / OCh 114) TaxID=375451 RepID=Q161F3_ROSDO|nr:alpha/beta fold hydrolase [Roseobacter denitrificans]ABG33390.1 esterase EstC, putative [Roseobacter denitrificans OCh 114]AVL52713.1 esterase [Roseobacter denitrificans]